MSRTLDARLPGPLQTALDRYRRRWRWTGSVRGLLLSLGFLVVAIGLSVTVGLGQGAFSVYPVDGADGEFMAVNEFNNAGLGLNGDGPVEYDKLGAQIRALLGQ